MPKYTPVGSNGHIDIYAATRWAMHKAQKHPDSAVSSKHDAAGVVVPTSHSTHVVARFVDKMRGRKNANRRGGQATLGAMQAAIDRDRHALGDKAADKGKLALQQLAITFGDKDISMASLALVLRDMVEYSMEQRRNAAAPAKALEGRADELARRREASERPEVIAPLEGLSASLQSLESDYRKHLDECPAYLTGTADAVPGPKPLPKTADPAAAMLVKTQNALRHLAYVATVLSDKLKKPERGARTLRAQLLDEELDVLLQPIVGGLKGAQLGERVHQRLAKCNRCWLAVTTALQSGQDANARDAMEHFQMEVEETISEMSWIGGDLVGSATQDPLTDPLRRSDRAFLYDLGQLFLQAADLLSQETGAFVQAHGTASALGQLDPEQLDQLAQQPAKTVAPLAPLQVPVPKDQLSSAEPRKRAHVKRRQRGPSGFNTPRPGRTASRALTTVRLQMPKVQAAPSTEAQSTPLQPLVKRSATSRALRNSAPPKLTQQQQIQQDQNNILLPQLNEMAEQGFLSPRRDGPLSEADAQLATFLGEELKPLSGPKSPRVTNPTWEHQAAPVEKVPDAAADAAPDAVPKVEPAEVPQAVLKQVQEDELADFLNQLENNPESIEPINLDGAAPIKHETIYAPIEPAVPAPENRRTSRVERMAHRVTEQLTKSNKSNR